MVSGHLAVKKNRWYAILCLRHPDGRRYDKWIATGLSYPGYMECGNTAFRVHT